MTSPDYTQGGASGYDPLRVRLPQFEGPLDLLLHLVRKQALDIQELRLTDLTEPYLAYLEQMEAPNLDHAAEFLAIAATLVWIKSSRLLPEQVQPEEPEAEAAEEELLLRLRAYQRVKEAAGRLAGLEMLGRDVFPRPPEELGAPAPGWQEVSLYDLMEAFRKALQRAEVQPVLRIAPDRVRIEERIVALIDALRDCGGAYFHQLLGSAVSRDALVLTLMALLEMARLKTIRLEQAVALGWIYCQTTQAFHARWGEWRSQLLRELAGAPGAEGRPTAPGAPESRAPRTS